MIILYIFIPYEINCNYKICEDYDDDDKKISNKENCLNNVIKFKSKKYQANNFAKNKNGDLIFELTELKEDDNEYSSSRLFYGITKEGHPFFANNTSYTYEIQINKNKELFDDKKYHYMNWKNSINLFVSLKNDLNKNNQYLFSINSHNSMVELFNLNDENSNYYLWNFNEFFNLSSNDYLFFNKYLFFELKEKNEYIIAFIPKNIVDNYILNLSFITKFIFKSFNEDTFKKINDIKYSDYLDTKIIDLMLLKDTLAVLTSKETKNDEIKSNTYLNNKYIFNLTFYNFDLTFYKYIKDIQLNNFLSENYNGETLFFKSLYLKDNYILFVYLIDYYFIFNLFKFDLSNFKKRESLINPLNYIEKKMDYSITDYIGFDELLSDIIKINNNRIAFIYTNKMIYYNLNGKK